MRQIAKYKRVRALTLVNLTLTLLFVVSCQEILYFNSAPRLNEPKSFSKEIQELKKYIGVYQLNYKDLDTVNIDIYRQDQYINYQRPVIGKTTDDTLRYFSILLLVNKYLEIYESDGKINFLGFNCVDKRILTQFFLNRTRTIKDSSTSTSITISLLSDSLKVKLHQLDFNTKITHDTIIKYRLWTRDSLICIADQKHDSFFPSSANIKTINNKEFNYITRFKNELFLVQRDTSKAKTKFQISNLRPNETGFVFRTTTDNLSRNEPILKELGLRLIDEKILEYKESKLLVIFKSELAEDIFEARRVLGFPSLINENTLFNDTYFILTGFILLVVILLLIINSKKRVESTSP